MLRKLILPALIAAPMLLPAQSYEDALRFSQSISAGTARYVSMGGAFGALGADFASLSSNPAGLGVYRSSEFSFTPSFKFSNANTKYLGETTSDTHSGLALDNLGFVASFASINPSDEKGLINFNMGFGYNRLIDFKSGDMAYGANSTSSIMDYYSSRASGNDWFEMDNADPNYDAFNSSNAPWDAILAWNTFLINTTDDYDYPTNMTYLAALADGDGVYQTHNRSSEGRVGEYVLSMGANISHFLYLGATLGIHDVFFNQTTIHSEDAFEGNSTLFYPDEEGGMYDRFNFMDYKQRLSIDGSGYNFKVGAIIRPIPVLRIGMAFHTPTYYKLREWYSASISSNFNSAVYRSGTPESRYDYRMETPSKAIGSVAYTFGGIGLVSAEVEYIDYTTARLRSGGDGYQFIDENLGIKSSLRNTVNLKAGGEVWLEDLALRAGFGWYSSPYKSGLLNSNANTKVISGGVGYRTGSMFIDMAYQHLLLSDSYLLYDIYDSQPVERNLSQGRVMMSIGFKF